MTVYIDQKVITWRRFKYNVESLSESEILEIMADEFTHQNCENTDKITFLGSETLDEYEETCSSNVDEFPCTEMIIEIGNAQKTIRQE